MLYKTMFPAIRGLSTHEARLIMAVGLKTISGATSGGKVRVTGGFPTAFKSN